MRRLRPRTAPDVTGSTPPLPNVEAPPTPASTQPVTPSSPSPLPPSSLKITVAFGGLLGTLAAGYGVLFTVVDDFNTEYGISESAIGLVIGIGFLAGFVSQVLIIDDAHKATECVAIADLVRLADVFTRGSIRPEAHHVRR